MELQEQFLQKHGQLGQYYAQHCLLEKGAFYIVADGCSDHLGSEYIAQQFCKNMIAFVKQYQFGSQVTETEIKSLISAAYEKSVNESEKVSYPDARASCGFILFNDGFSVIGHIGDVRIYRYTQWIPARAKDDNWAKVARKADHANEAYQDDHPLSNLPVKTINLQKAPDFTIRIDQPLAMNESILICTDGIWRVLGDRNITKLFQSKKGLNSLPENLIDDATAYLIRPKNNIKKFNSKRIDSIVFWIVILEIVWWCVMFGNYIGGSPPFGLSNRVWLWGMVIMGILLGGVGAILMWIFKDSKGMENNMYDELKF